MRSGKVELGQSVGLIDELYDRHVNLLLSAAADTTVMTMANAIRAFCDRIGVAIDQIISTADA